MSKESDDQARLEHHARVERAIRESKIREALANKAAAEARKRQEEDLRRREGGKK